MHESARARRADWPFVEVKNEDEDESRWQPQPSSSRYATVAPARPTRGVNSTNLYFTAQVPQLERRIAPNGRLRWQDARRNDRDNIGRADARVDGGEEHRDAADPEEPEVFSETPWFDPRNLNTAEQLNYTTQTALHDEIVAFTNYVDPIAQESEARRLVVDRLEMVVRRAWPGSRVEVFGSVAFGLVLPDGDIDAVIVFPRPLSPHAPKGLLHRLSTHLKATGIAERVQVIAKSKVPIIIVQTTKEYGSFSVDMSFAVNDNSGLTAIPLVKKYLQEMPALRPLVLVVKSYLALNGINSAATAGLSSYAVICMCISFLQLNPKTLPRCTLTSPLSEKSLGTLLIAFFEYYGNEFPYETAVISVATASLLDKKQKGWVVRNQPELLSIECPVNRDKNVSKGTGRIKRVRALFMDAAHVLRLAAERDAEGVDKSLLGRIIRLSQSTQSRRKEICELVKSGRLRRSVASNLAIVRTNFDRNGDEPERYQSQNRDYQERSRFSDGRDREGRNVDVRYAPYWKGGRRDGEREHGGRGGGSSWGRERGKGKGREEPQMHRGDWEFAERRRP